MAEPLGIVSGIIAVLGAAKQLYKVIEGIADAPDVLERAKFDVRMTVEILESLHKHLGGPTADIGQQYPDLSPVLSRCKLKCDALKYLLGRSAKNSDKISLGDRMRLALKEEDIEDLRMDISLARESLALALSSLVLYAPVLFPTNGEVPRLTFSCYSVTSTNSHDAIERYQGEASKTMQDITDRMNKIQITIEVMGNDLGEEKRRRLADRDLALREHLSLCRESANNVEEHARYKSEFGNTNAAQEARLFAGIATQHLHGGVDQRFGDSNLGARSITFMGAGDTDAVLGFFQQGSHHVGGSAVSDHGASTPEVNLTRWPAYSQRALPSNAAVSDSDIGSVYRAEEVSEYVDND
ncbi:uncharacterized protein DSM5745_04349 [Aspergillus mulundensis]|uniref:NACHT-NTPase and P-loop NTPases N-terminal domain-containing protein n=1 Tax=Aspergillus mulundensis TaxID=1810919 RepID=A0A3D8SCL6_9EURO|nr:hypothetical protein DSM5745_04349 [Aspergillus mulundensis]RDW84023.1 hypothetical protein DSM5745_04349 [Aspergillus mulundensis]